MRLVRIDTIEPGACLAQDVSWGHTVVPQLRAGVVLTDRYLERLQQAGLSAVYVQDAEDVGDEPATQLTGEEVAVPAVASVAPAPERARADDVRAAAPTPVAGRLRHIANACWGSRAALS